MKNKLLILFIVFQITVVFAQKKCLDAFVQSERLYENGQIPEAIKLLEPCVKKFKNSQEIFEAYRLLALCYQLQKKESKALQYIGMMLKMNPEYQRFPNIDPVEFTKLVNTFRVRPLFYVGIQSGIWISSVNVTNKYAVMASKQVYTPTLGYQLGAFFEWMFKEQVSLQSGIQLVGIGTNCETQLSDASIQHITERHSYTNGNITGKYYFSRTKFQPYVGLSMGINVLNSAILSMETTKTTTQSIYLASSDVYNERTKIQWSPGMQLGCALKSDLGTFFFDLGYSFFTNQTVNPDKRYERLNWIFDNQYIADDLELYHFSFAVGMKIPLKLNISRK